MTILKKDKYGKGKPEKGISGKKNQKKGQFWIGQFWKRIILEKKI